MRLAAALLAAAALLPSCGRDGGPRAAALEPAIDSRPPAAHSAAAAAARGDTLVVAIASDPSTLNPLVEASSVAAPILHLIHPSLAEAAFQDCQVSFTPGVANSWDWSDGDRTLTFHLRPGVAWTDGAALTSKDVRTSFTLLGDPATASPRASYVSEVASIDTPTPRTVVFRFRRAYDRATQMLHTGYPFVASHVFAGVAPGNLRGHPASRAPVGAGPFRFERWEKGTELVLSRNDEWMLPHPPHLDRIVFRVLADPAMRVAELQRGNVDLVDDLTPRDARAIRRATSRVRILDRGPRYLDFVVWNLHHPAFAERDVRRAMTLAIDRDRILHMLLDSGGTPAGRLATGTTPPVLCQDSNAALRPLPYDPARAEALLTARGWIDGDGDGVREKEGTPLRFTLSYDAGNTRREKTAILVRGMLAAVGAGVTLQARDRAAHFAALRRHDFDAGLFGIGAGLIVDPTPFWKSGEDSVLNLSGYENPRVDALLDRARGTLDPKERRGIWREIEAIIHEDQPWTFLFWRDQVLGVDARFRGVRADVISPLHGIADWWVPLPEQRYGPAGGGDTAGDSSVGGGDTASEGSTMASTS